MIIAPAQRTGIPNLSSFLPKGANETPVLQYFVERIDAANASDFTTFETIINGPQLAHYLYQNHKNMLAKDTIDDTVTWLSKNVRVRGVGTTPYRKITIRTHDRDQAQELLELLFTQTDHIIRQNALSKTTRRIAYLKEELKKTMHPDHRDAMIALLKEQERTAMTVAIDNNFAAVPIEEPHTLSKPIAPDWRILFPVFILAGGFIGLLIGGFTTAMRRT